MTTDQYPLPPLPAGRPLPCTCLRRRSDPRTIVQADPFCEAAPIHVAIEAGLMPDTLTIRPNSVGRNGTEQP